MFEQVHTSVLQFGRFTEQELTLLTERLKFTSCKRQSVLLKKGQICNALYFIHHGSFRQYFVSEDGHVNIVDLFSQGEWLLDYQSFTSQKPSDTIFEAMQDSELLVLGVYELHELIKLSNSFFALGRILERGMQNQQYRSSHLTPEEKYTLLLTNKPELINQFPSKYIASFLGMAPETLSRVRRKIIS